MASLPSGRSIDDLWNYVIAIYRELTGRLEVPNTAFVQLAPLGAEPSKPQEGMVVLANGVTWNPGSGPGIYYYYSGVWTFLG